MYVHSLWSETTASLQTLAVAASEMLGVPVQRSERSALLTVLARTEADSSDARWRQVPFYEPPAEFVAVRLYRSAFAIGIASVNSSLNFWLRERLGENLQSPLRLRDGLIENLQSTLQLAWRDRPIGVPDGWQLSAVQLQHAEAHTDVVVQGDVDDPGVLLREAGRLGDYGLAGMSLTDSRGRMVTLYDEGQIWLQQVDPDEVLDVLDLILPFLGRG
jgi:hypothetical protein